MSVDPLADEGWGPSPNVRDNQTFFWSLLCEFSARFACRQSLVLGIRGEQPVWPQTKHSRFPSLISLS